MSFSLVTQPSLSNHARPLWEVESVRAGDGSAIVRLGVARFVVSDVVSVASEARITSHRHGRIAAMFLFGMLACGFLISNLEFGVQARVLVAAFICGALSLMSFQDILRSHPQRLNVFDIRLRDGRRIQWTTMDCAAAAAVNALLAQRG